LFIVRNGKVVEGKEYLDTALVERVFGKTEAHA
jgi:ketosteroid isomerase-like protein